MFVPSSLFSVKNGVWAAIFLAVFMATPAHSSTEIFVLDFEGIRADLTLILAFLYVVTVGRILFHNPKVNQLLPESSLIIVVGALAGALAVAEPTFKDVLQFNSDTFFFVLLPPIIFEAGYHLNQAFFFRNLGTIVLYAVVGTLISTFLIGFTIYLWSLGGLMSAEIPMTESLVYGSLISAVDPVAVLAIFEDVSVNETLNMLVFGESVLNDAVAIVLYRLFESILSDPHVDEILVASAAAKFVVVALGGLLMGVIFGILASFTTKFTQHITIVEPIVVYLCAFLSYSVAETFHFSGIMSILVSGITMANYARFNLSPKSHTTVKYTLKMCAGLTETVIFLILGSSIVLEEHTWDLSFISISIISTLVFRFIIVFFLTWLANKRRLNNIPIIDQVVMAYGGLRGAIAFALAYVLPAVDVPNRSLLVTTTLMVVLFTIFVQGITIKPLIMWLQVKLAGHDVGHARKALYSRVFSKIFEFLPDAMSSIATGEEHTFRDILHGIHTEIMMPVLLRNAKKDDILFALQKQRRREGAGAHQGHLHNKPPGAEGMGMASASSNGLADETGFGMMTTQYSADSGRSKAMAASHHSAMMSHAGMVEQEAIPRTSSFASVAESDFGGNGQPAAGSSGKHHRRHHHRHRRYHKSDHDRSGDSLMAGGASTGVSSSAGGSGNVSPVRRGPAMGAPAPSAIRAATAAKKAKAGSLMETNRPGALEPLASGAELMAAEYGFGKSADAMNDVFPALDASTGAAVAKKRRPSLWTEETGAGSGGFSPSSSSHGLPLRGSSSVPTGRSSHGRSRRHRHRSHKTGPTTSQEAALAAVSGARQYSAEPEEVSPLSHHHSEVEKTDVVESSVTDFSHQPVPASPTAAAALVADVDISLETPTGENSAVEEVGDGEDTEPTD